MIHPNIKKVNLDLTDEENLRLAADRAAAAGDHATFWRLRRRFLLLQAARLAEEVGE